MCYRRDRDAYVAGGERVLVFPHEGDDPRGSSGGRETLFPGVGGWGVGKRVRERGVGRMLLCGQTYISTATFRELALAVPVMLRVSSEFDGECRRIALGRPLDCVACACANVDRMNKLLAIGSLSYN